MDRDLQSSKAPELLIFHENLRECLLNSEETICTITNKLEEFTPYRNTSTEADNGKIRAVEEPMTVADQFRRSLIKARQNESRLRELLDHLNQIF